MGPQLHFGAVVIHSLLAVDQFQIYYRYLEAWKEAKQLLKRLKLTP